MRFCANGFTHGLLARFESSKAYGNVFAGCPSQCIHQSSSGRRCTHILCYGRLWTYGLRSQLNPVLIQIYSFRAEHQSWTYEKAQARDGQFVQGELYVKKTKNAVVIFRSKKSFRQRPAAFTGLFRYLLPNHSHRHSHSHRPQTKFYSFFFSIKKLFFRIRPKSFFTHSPIKRFKTNS